MDWNLIAPKRTSKNALGQRVAVFSANQLPENGSRYVPTEEEQVYNELVNGPIMEGPAPSGGWGNLRPAPGQSKEEWARDMTKQVMARRAANKDSRNLWQRFADTSNFVASVPVRVITKGEYGLGDVLNDEGVLNAEARFVKYNATPLEYVSRVGEVLGGIPQLAELGAIPKVAKNALAKSATQMNALAQRFPKSSELSRTTFSGGIPEAKAALAMDEASRMARAKEMGYDTSQKWYHGTSGDHTNLDPNYSGSVSSGDGRGIWFTDNPRYAGEYAENAAGIRGGDPRIIEAYLAPKKPLVIEFDEYGKPMVGGNRVEFTNNSDAINYALKNGYDAVHWPNGSFTDDPAMTIFKPNQIRDIGAAFDPNKSHLSDIMAGVAGMLGIPALSASTSRRD